MILTSSKKSTEMILSLSWKRELRLAFEIMFFFLYMLAPLIVNMFSWTCPPGNNWKDTLKGILLDSFHLNEHILEFHPQTETQHFSLGVQLEAKTSIKLFKWGRKEQEVNDSVAINFSKFTFTFESESSWVSDFFPAEREILQKTLRKIDITIPMLTGNPVVPTSSTYSWRGNITFMDFSNT